MGKYLDMGLGGCMLTSYEKLLKNFPKWLYHSALPRARYKSSACSVDSPAFGVADLFNGAILNVGRISSFWLQFAFPED